MRYSISRLSTADLKNELETALPAESKPVASYHDLQQIPYPTLAPSWTNPSAADRAWRSASRDAQQRQRLSAAAGTTISSPLSAPHLSEDLFSNTSTFTSER